MQVEDSCFMQIQPPDNNLPNQVFTEREKINNLRRFLKKKELHILICLVGGWGMVVVVIYQILI